MLTAAATLLAPESSHEREGNTSRSEDATNILRELVDRLDDMVPMVFLPLFSSANLINFTFVNILLQRIVMTRLTIEKANRSQKH